MIRKLLAATGVALVASSAMAAGMTLSSAVFVESYVLDKDGTMQRRLSSAKTIIPGSNVVYVLSYKNGGSLPAGNFAITNPVPREIEFIGGETPGWEVSVDGAKSFGALASLTVRGSDGSIRPARPTDVTHIRWKLASAVPAGASGQVAFKGKLK